MVSGRKTRRKCDGYGTPSPPRNYHDILVPVFPPSTLSYVENNRESRCFQFFYERTVPALAGYCGSEFWSRLVLQVSQHEKSVWHALIALGSLHENFETDNNTFGIDFLRHEQDSFAIREYLAAIRALLGPSNTTFGSAGTVTVDVCLISCILFTCFEILSGHYGPAINHVQSGINILKEVYHDPSSGTFRHPHLLPSTVTSLEMESLRKIFLRLQGQALTLTRADTYHLMQEVFAVPDTPQFSHDIPNVFSSIADARDAFELLNRNCVNHYRIIMQSVSPTDASEMSQYLLRQYEACFDRWCIAFSRFEESRGDSLTTKERIGLKLLNMHKHNTMMYLDAMVAEKIIEIEEAAALKAVLDYSDFPLESALSGQELEKNVNNITDSTQIPEGVRLTYAHPKFNVAEKKVFLTVGQTAKMHMKMHMDIPWSNMNFLVDAET
ncbi:hypothetical protein TCE0_011r00665 [Talaromyces pinophilus]|uniref:Uncharacterized protein n=1 Tax=Talaromyces pinophilus TaxID=128442 RepID=A0A0B8N2S4_TALPI|nr:hypothetical protein TCE0_011r00665 [Talaromyces pinophilus]